MTMDKPVLAQILLNLLRLFDRLSFPKKLLDIMSLPVYKKPPFSLEFRHSFQLRIFGAAMVLRLEPHQTFTITKSVSYVVVLCQP